MNTSNLPEHKQTQSIQSWYEPALRTLVNYLEAKKAQLRKVKGDEKNAAVKREELKRALNRDHCLTFSDADLVISSMYRAGKIFIFGEYIQLPRKEEA
ncbi:hypothetical protein QSV37_05040 [Acinetobacter sp. VNK23]|uniref:hypothetical protein n=1 Tax=Acinetobacter thutiue TaxID=2998078 RepID=UPI00257867CE|nr:hypothetical protein [Acinetobacter thutiue]MDM1019677.1 hypothetical protein [Acinetobacter thutiue]